MGVSFNDRVRVAPNVLFRVVSDELVLVNLDTEVYLGLNPTGARMWNALSSAGSVERAYDELLQEYDVDPPELRRDLEDFLDRLLAEKLVETVPPPA